MKHNLYLVQDSDRPMHVVAGDFGAAVARWEKAVRAENEGAIGPDDKVTPQCVQLVCEASELLLPAARIPTDAEVEGCDADSLRQALFDRSNDVARLIKERDAARADVEKETRRADQNGGDLDDARCRIADLEEEVSRLMSRLKGGML